MVLPIILSLLGSGAAGAGILGSMSPLIAGAIGSGIGSAIQTGSLEEGIKSGLTAGVLGGIGGKLLGGAGDTAQGVLGQAPASATGMTSAVGANPMAGMTGAQMLPGAATVPATGGITNMLKNVPSGMSAVGTAPTGVPISEMIRAGLNKGVLTGAGMGTAYGAAASMPQRTQFASEEEYNTPRSEPMQRSRYTPPVGYRPGVDPEFQYFSPAKMAGGGMVAFNPTGQAPIAMQGGGLADIAAATSPQPAAPMPPMNEKAIVEGTIAAVQGKIPEEQAAPILAAFVQTYGEEALRKLVDDVRGGRTPQGGEGPVRGPGDGMDDMVPARMDDGSSDVLLSDGEFVIPADVVSGLGNGSTDAGAAELDRMMGRVREARTGKTEQPAAVAAGGMVPA
ncbi:hypothetical protein N9Q05_01475 [bacterium]|nr:hypothetical protein [bacterium]